MKLSRRTDILKPSPTLALAQKARELAGLGKPVISLTVGEPDWPTDEVVSAEAHVAIDAGFTKYTAAAGIPDLRTLIARNFSSEFGVHYSVPQICVGAGAKFLLYSIFQMILNTGDEVIIPAPYWVSYPAMVELSDGRAVCPTCTEKENFKLSAAALEKAITPKTRALILCSPSNPTGICYTAAELAALGEVLKKHPEIWIVSDDIYNRLIFSGEKFASHILRECPELADRTFCVNGASKTFSMTGWRLGWMCGPMKVMAFIADYLSQTTSNANSIAQKAVIPGIIGQDAWVAKTNQVLITRYKIFSEGLAEIPMLKVTPAQGAFYIWLDVAETFGKTHRGTGQTIKDSADVCQIMLDYHYVATVPGLEFGLDGYLRLSFAASETQLLEAITRFRDFTANLG